MKEAICLLAITAFAAHAQPLTDDELQPLREPIQRLRPSVEEGGLCALVAVRHDDVIFAAAVLNVGDEVISRFLVALDAKDQHILDTWEVDDLVPPKALPEYCAQKIELVNIAPAHIAVWVQGFDQHELITFESGKLKSQLIWGPRGKDKATFRLRKSVANGFLDLELKRGKEVEIYKWTGSEYARFGEGNPYLGGSWASSELPRQGDFTYGYDDAVDLAPETAWAEGKRGNGVGEQLLLNIDGAYRIEKLKLIPGCGFTAQLWLKNERIKKLKIIFDDNTEQIAELEDTRNPGEWKSITITHERPTATLKLEIADIYPGSAWQDGCISEVAIEPKLTPMNGELAKSSTFLGLSCKSDFATVTAAWKLTKKFEKGYLLLDEVNTRVGKSRLLQLHMDNDKRVVELGLEGCAGFAAVAASLPKDDLAARLCPLTMDEVRRTFGDPPVKKRLFHLEYPWGGGTLTLHAGGANASFVGDIKLSCPK
jgi:hypothetical protein